MESIKMARNRETVAGIAESVKAACASARRAYHVASDARRAGVTRIARYAGLKMQQRCAGQEEG